jgi:predicted Fe-Mo cluster-binding NifX family protein
MEKQKIAIPTKMTGDRSGHFGHCPQFTLIEIENGAVTGISYLENPQHPANGCMQPVALLKANQVDTIILGGIGAKPFKRLTELGINVLFADHKKIPDVKTAIDFLIASKLMSMHPIQLCDGSGKCHQHHGKI